MQAPQTAEVRPPTGSPPAEGRSPLPEQTESEKSHGFEGQSHSIPLNRDHVRQSAGLTQGLTLVKGDLNGAVKALQLSKSVMRNIPQNLFFAFIDLQPDRRSDRGGYSLSLFGTFV